MLQRLVRFDTTSPPGNEAPCIHYIDEILTGAGFDTTILSSDEAHPNLVTRLPGRGDAPPLLMYGHVDVVTTNGQPWTQPPFEGRVVDGYVWGRGTLDMKGAVTMMLAALLRAKAERLVPPGDVILALVSGEEIRADYGAAHLVAEHADHFEGVRYAIGELGGFSLHLGDTTVYPIMVAEKQLCWMRATVRGPAGHGSMPVRAGAMAKLARLLRQLDERRLPVHVTPVARQMIEQIASLLSFPKGIIVRQLLNPAMTDRVLALLGSTGELFDPILHNTVSPTILHASDKVNVIPGEVSVELDGRLLPGYAPDDLVAELRHLLGDEVELNVLKYDPGPPEPDMGLFDTLSRILREGDPEGTPVPLIVPGVTDASQFARLGIQTYGFTPMKMPAGLSFWRLLHGVDERIPVDALAFGIEAIYKLLERFGEVD
jgi:acetylornithine deacetylase/succinyl-diaminopimelate desuccinylase-like protein